MFGGFTFAQWLTTRPVKVYPRRPELETAMVREVYKAKPKGPNDATVRKGSPESAALGSAAIPE